MLFHSARRKLFLIKSLPFVAVFFTFLWLRGRLGPDGQFEADDEAMASTPLPFSREVLEQLIARQNQRQYVLNMDKFGPLSPGDPVLVVQVHNRDQYLQALVDSLRNVRGIEKSLVIFSHDVFDLRINAIVEQIDFCKVSALVNWCLGSSSSSS